MTCPLCQSSKASLHAQATVEQQARSFYRCQHCALIFVPAQYHVTAAAAKQRYDLHQNNPADPGYCQFLQQCVDPLVPWLRPGMQALDYGSGPGPAMPQLLAPYSVDCTLYDPAYAPDTAVLQVRYDVVTCTETAEHFATPAQQFARMLELLQPDGLLAIMTQWVEPQANFTTWHYIHDATHIAFYSAATWDWIASHYGLKIVYEKTPVVIYRTGRN